MNQQDAAAGLDFLLVLGVKDSPGGTTDWTPRLEELFNAHHYTDGLSFVARAHLRTTRWMRRPASVRRIPATKRVIRPNAPQHHFSQATDRMSMC